MVKSLLLVLVLAVLSAGCSTQQVTATGTGNFYTLSDRNVIERDLTRPVSVDNEPEYPSYDSFPAPL